VTTHPRTPPARRLALLALLPAAALAAGCATAGGYGPEVVGGAWSAPGARLSAYASFDALPLPPGAQRPTGPSFATLEVYGAVADRLSAVGLGRAISGTPDLLVACWQGGSPVDEAAFGYAAAGVPGSLAVAALPPSTLVVDLVDARTRALAWRGAAAGALDSPAGLGPALAALLPGWPPPGSF